MQESPWLRSLVQGKHRSQQQRRAAAAAAAAARAVPTPTRRRAQSGCGTCPRIFGSSVATPNCAPEAESQPPTPFPRASLLSPMRPDDYRVSEKVKWGLLPPACVSRKKFLLELTEQSSLKGSVWGGESWRNGPSSIGLPGTGVVTANRAPTRGLPQRRHFTHRSTEMSKNRPQAGLGPDRWSHASSQGPQAKTELR